MFALILVPLILLVPLLSPSSINLALYVPWWNTNAWVLPRVTLGV